MEMAPSEPQGLQGRTALVTSYPPSGRMRLDHSRRMRTQPAPCISSFIPSRCGQKVDLHIHLPEGSEEDQEPSQGKLPPRVARDK